MGFLKEGMKNDHRNSCEQDIKNIRRKPRCNCSLCCTLQVDNTNINDKFFKARVDADRPEMTNPYHRFAITYFRESGIKEAMTANILGESDWSPEWNLVAEYTEKAQLNFEWGPHMVGQHFKKHEVHFCINWYNEIVEKASILGGDEDNWVTKEHAIKECWELVK